MPIADLLAMILDDEPGETVDLTGHSAESAEFPWLKPVTRKCVGLNPEAWAR